MVRLRRIIRDSSNPKSPTTQKRLKHRLKSGFKKVSYESLHLVPSRIVIKKKEGSCRIWVDIQKLNTMVVPLGIMVSALDFHAEGVEFDSQPLQESFFQGCTASCEELTNLPRVSLCHEKSGSLAVRNRQKIVGPLRSW